MRTARTHSRHGSRIRDQDGQATWANQLVILGLVLAMAGLIFGFWRAGGMTWVQSTLSHLTSY